LRNDKKALVNVPYVDNSYKWAGGGILSTVGDLIKYGNHLLKSYQQKDETNMNTYLKSSTIKSYVWAPQSQPPKDDLPYGLGWHLNIDKNKLDFNVININYKIYFHFFLLINILSFYFFYENT